MNLTEKEKKLIDDVQGGFYDLWQQNSQFLYEISLAIKRLGIKKEKEELGFERSDKNDDEAKDLS